MFLMKVTNEIVKYDQLCIVINEYCFI